MTPTVPLRSPPLDQLMKIFTPEDDRRLREVLKGCPSATCEAAREFRQTRNPALLPVIVHGMVERYVARDLLPRLKLADDDLLLHEHLGLDSLTMMELMMIAEDVLQISIDNTELRGLHTMGDLQRFVARKLEVTSPAKPISLRPEAVN
jgi:acyl carrier protein